MRRFYLDFYQQFSQANSSFITFTCITILLTCQVTSVAQEKVDETMLLRIYEDNDFINVRGEGTDRWYSHGLRIDLFYSRNESTFFLSRAFPKAGQKSINTHGWGVTHIFMTPSDITKSIPDSWDYPYASTLSITRSLHSSNPYSKVSFQSEFSIGVLGPASMAKELQTFIHKRIHDEIPMGWNTQWKNDLLFNYTTSIEKQLLYIGSWADVMFGGRIAIGSSLTGSSIYTILRFGKMNNYFNGLLSRFLQANAKENEWQIYMTIIPSFDFSARNALLVGGLFRRNDSTITQAEDSEFRRTPARLLLNLSYGLTITSRKISLSITQKSFSAFIKGLPRHEVGNITLYFKLSEIDHRNPSDEIRSRSTALNHKG